ncbi:hypothetical protein D9M68_959270 [compost metagenome]
MKMTSSTTTSSEAMAPSGSTSRNWKIAMLTSARPAASVPLPSMTWAMAPPPKAVNQAMVTRVGTTITTPTICRRVRPRETRATNTPTCGPQVHHQAQ